MLDAGNFDAHPWATWERAVNLEERAEQLERVLNLRDILVP